MTVPRGTPPGVEQSAALQEDQLRRIAALERASTSGSGGSVVIPDPLLLADGSAAAPSLAFTADTDTGMYRPGTNQIGFTAGGTQVLQLSTADVDVTTGHLNVISNTGAQTISLGEWSSGSNFAAIESPSMVILLGNTSGVDQANYIRSKGTGTLNLGVNNSNDLWINNGGAVYAVGDITAGGDIVTAIGSAGAPSHTFTGFTTTGMFHRGTNEIGFTTAGTENLRLTGSNLRMASATSTIYNVGYYRGVAATGTVSSPTYSWDGDSDTGMYRHNADDLAFTTGGTRRVSIANSGVYAFVPVRTIDGTAAAPPHSFTSDTNTGMYRAAADTIGWSLAGVRKMQLSPDRLYLYGGTNVASYIGPINASYFYNVTSSGAFYFNKTLRCAGNYSSHTGDLNLQRALVTKMTMTGTDTTSNQRFIVNGPNLGTTTKTWSYSQLQVRSLNTSGNDASNSLAQMAFWNRRYSIAPIVRNFGPEGEKMGFANNANSAFVPIIASALQTSSTIRIKQDIEAVEDADAIALAEKFLLTSFMPKVRPQNTVVSDRFADVNARWVASSEERTDLTPRTQDWESHDHDCGVDPCDGSVDSPCQVTVNDTRRFGGLAEWWGDVTPEQVSFDEGGIADSIDIDQVATTALGAVGALSRKLTAAMETIDSLQDRLADLEEVQ